MASAVTKRRLKAMRIWFNHWFSTAYHFIDMLKPNNTIIASNERTTCVYRMNADEFYVEPTFKDENDYIDWCLNFCKSFNIDIFFIKRGMATAVKRHDEFDKINVKLIAEDDYVKFELFNDKIQTAEFFRQHNICKVPEMKTVTTLEQFKHEYAELSLKYDSLCIKYNHDEGGQSYKLIKTRMPKLSRISENNGLVYSYEYICACLQEYNTFPELIIMPYLNGTEISIDCIALNSKLIAIPRYKLSNKVTKFDMDKHLISIAEKFQEKAELSGPYNLQFRYHNGELYLLEVNTRLSGGSWKAHFIGCDFPVLCVNKVTNTPIDTVKLKANFKNIELSNIESVVELS